MAKRRTIRRFAITAIVFLLLGVVVNVAVATILAVIPNDYPSFQQDTGENSGAFEAIVAESRGYHTIDICPGEIILQESPGLTASSTLGIIEDNRYYNSLPSWSRFKDRVELEAIYSEYFGGRCFLTYTEHAVGWPCLSTRSRYISVICDVDVSPRVVDNETEFLGRPLRIGHASNVTKIPLRPIWPGFAVNSALYAGAVWIVFAFPLAFRRWNRTRRGLCSKCKYPVGDNPVCTECGAAVNPLRKRT